MAETEKERNDKEYIALLAILKAILAIDDPEKEDERWGLIQELMAARAELAFQHACRGFNISFDEALKILKDTSKLSAKEAEKRKILVAAIENIVEFSVAQEYQALTEMNEFDPEEEGEETGEPSEDEDVDPDEHMDWLLSIFSTYNKRYAFVENLDIAYAMSVAAAMLSSQPKTLLTYMTQGDERVRPWHLQYEGYSAFKEDFPEWLIPPIEHQCRCYLVEDDVFANAATKPKKGKLEMPEWFNPTFKESVALGGRIFSDEHPYFQVKPRHKERLKEFTAKILNQYLPNYKP